MAWHLSWKKTAFLSTLQKVKFGRMIDESIDFAKQSPLHITESEGVALSRPLRDIE